MWKVLFVVCLLGAIAASPASRECKGKEIHREVTGVIKSHRGYGYGKKWKGYIGYGGLQYANNLNCTWIIVGRPNKDVRLLFRDFDLQGSDYCTLDSLTVYDGPDVTSLVIEKLCRNRTSFYIFSSGRSLTLRFTTDASITDGGFIIEYDLVDRASRECKGKEIHREERGVIKSHRGYGYGKKELIYYANNLNCTWIIVGRPNKDVVLFFFYIFNLQCSDYCTRDSLTVYDGPDVTSPVIAKLCGHRPTSFYNFSSGRSLTLRFTTDASITGWGFIIKYFLIDRLAAPAYQSSRAVKQSCSSCFLIIFASFLMLQSRLW